MYEQTLVTTDISLVLADSTVSRLRQEYLGYQQLYNMQPQLVQRFLATQAALITEAMMADNAQLSFNLPDRVNCTNEGGGFKLEEVPSEYRRYTCGDLTTRLTRKELRIVFQRKILELEHSTNLAVAVNASLLLHAVVIHLVHNMLPSGRLVDYSAMDGEEIASIPVQRMPITRSAMTDSKDEIFDVAKAESGRGELLVPYVEAARRFYLPQWVAFDDEGKLLVRSITEAEAHIASMQRYMSILYTAVGLAPYMVADEEYQLKRCGILGQLVNQGRALASYKVQEIIQTINRRAVSHDLDRGLWLSLP